MVNAKGIISKMDNKIKSKYSVKRKGTFIKYKVELFPDSDDQIYPIIRYTYNNIEYVEKSSSLSCSRNWLYAKNGDKVDIFINPDNPTKYYATIPKLTPEGQIKENNRNRILSLIIIFGSIFIIIICLIVHFISSIN